MKKINKKKKGFTLIELVIVLAVLAIIALIAIPNFTKVRNDSLIKADARTGEQIKKITLMAIANEDVKVTTGSGTTDIELTFGDDGIEVGDEGIYNDDGTNYKTMLKEVKAPQVNGKDGYVVKIDNQGNVKVYYNGGTETLTE